MEAQQVLIGAQELSGALVVPPQACGLVVIADDCRGARQRERSRLTARVLEQLRMATLLPELLFESEVKDEPYPAHIELLNQRLEQVLVWLSERRDLTGLSVGLLGISMAAAAALMAAALNPSRIGAVVSRSGRPDLAAGYLPRVEAPTLLIVGGADALATQFNRSALAQLHCSKRLESVPGVKAAFDEPAAMETVSHLTGAWFVRHLVRKRNL